MERHSRGLKPQECDPLKHGLYAGKHEQSKPLIPTDERMAEAVAEMQRTAQAPYIGDQLPEQIDLCLFDGGEYATRFDFLKLFRRCRVIALDDIRRDMAWKNYANYQGLCNPSNPHGWNLMFHRPYERHGWSVFIRVPKRPNGKLFPLCQTIDDIDRVLAPTR